MRYCDTSIWRKLLAIVFVFLLVGALGPVPALAAADRSAVSFAEINDIFEVANEEYKAGNYANAIKLYESLLPGAEPIAADVYYNIGNAQYKLGRYGKAIVAYRRALRVAPRDQDGIANLNFVRGTTRDTFDQPKSTELLHEMLFMHYSLSRHESEAVFFGAYIAAVVFGIGYLLRRSSKLLRWLTAAAFAMALLFGASTFLHWYDAVHPGSAVVVVDQTDAHTGPGDKYIVSLTLHDGAELTIREREAEWLQVELSDGRRGWVRNSDVEPV